MSDLHLSLAGVALAVVGAGAWLVSLYNAVQRYLNMIPEIASNIGVLRRKRADLVGALEDVVARYGLHEKAIALGISGEFAGRGMDTGSSLIARLSSLRMAFPELRADGLYSSLMEQLATVETELSSRREQYNSVVRAHNTVIAEFPGNLLLRPFTFQAQAFLVEQTSETPRTASAP